VWGAKTRSCCKSSDFCGVSKPASTVQAVAGG
jgi:hypothetical protein